MAVALVVTFCFGVIQALNWWRGRRYAAAFLGAVYLIVYVADMWHILSTANVILSPTITLRVSSPANLGQAGFSVILTWFVFSFLVQAFPPRSLGIMRREIRIQPVVTIVAALLLMAIIAREVRAAGLVETLQLRQGVFGESLLGLVGYFGLPTLAVLAFVAARAAAFWRIPLYLVCMGAALLTFATGSRTSLFLSLAFPILLLLWRRSTLRLPSIRRDVTRLALLAAAAVLPILGGAWYLSRFRGTDNTDNGLFESVDVSQADVLVALMDAGPEHSNGSSYLAGLLFFVPRGIWPEKPLPANVETSLLLAPERYAATGAEITSGVMGEAFLAWGAWAGPVFVGVLLAAVALVLDRILRYRNECVWILGVLILMRGTNLIRGDLVNVVAPLAVTLLIWLVVCRRNRVLGAKPAGETVLRS